MNDAIDRHLAQWTRDARGTEALIAVFNQIRDIPYSVLPELNDPHRYPRLLEIRAGSCTPKHLLLAEMYRRLGLEVLLAVYPYRWDEFEDLYPPPLRRLARAMPPANHLACKVRIRDRDVLVDATIDPPLGRIGLPVNQGWDGASDTSLPVEPTGPEEIYHPTEAQRIEPPRLDEKTRHFYQGLNAFLAEIRGA